MTYVSVWWRQVLERLLSYHSLENVTAAPAPEARSRNSEPLTLQRGPDMPHSSRWRADMNGEYFIVGFGLEVSSQQDTRSKEDNDWFAVGNYFRSRAEAEMVTDWMREGLLYIHHKDRKSFDRSLERLLSARMAVQQPVRY